MPRGFLKISTIHQLGRVQKAARLLMLFHALAPSVAFSCYVVNCSTATRFCSAASFLAKREILLLQTVNLTDFSSRQGVLRNDKNDICRHLPCARQRKSLPILQQCKVPLLLKGGFRGSVNEKLTLRIRPTPLFLTVGTLMGSYLRPAVLVDTPAISFQIPLCHFWKRARKTNSLPRKGAFSAVRKKKNPCPFQAIS